MFLLGSWQNCSSSPKRCRPDAVAPRAANCAQIPTPREIRPQSDRFGPRCLAPLLPLPLALRITLINHKMDSGTDDPVPRKGECHEFSHDAFGGPDGFRIIPVADIPSRNPGTNHRCGSRDASRSGARAGSRNGSTDSRRRSGRRASHQARRLGFHRDRQRNYCRPIHTVRRRWLRLGRPQWTRGDIRSARPASIFAASILRAGRSLLIIDGVRSLRGQISGAASGLRSSRIGNSTAICNGSARLEQVAPSRLLQIGAFTKAQFLGICGAELTQPE